MGQILTNSKTLVSIYVEIVSKCLLNLEEEDEMLSSGYAKSRMIISRLDIAHCLKITKNVSF